MFKTQLFILYLKAILVKIEGIQEITHNLIFFKQSLMPSSDIYPNEPKITTQIRLSRKYFSILFQ